MWRWLRRRVLGQMGRLVKRLRRRRRCHQVGRRQVSRRIFVRHVCGAVHGMRVTVAFRPMGCRDIRIGRSRRKPRPQAVRRDNRERRARKQEGTEADRDTISKRAVIHCIQRNGVLTAGLAYCSVTRPVSEIHVLSYATAAQAGGADQRSNDPTSCWLNRRPPAALKAAALDRLIVWIMVCVLPAQTRASLPSTVCLRSANRRRRSNDQTI